MYIRCPKCGRRGHLPDKWAPEAHSLRCRKCRALFKTPELAHSTTGQAVVAGFDAIAGVGRSDTRSAYLNDALFSGFDDPVVGTRLAGPGDSNYELTFTLGDTEGDSEPEWGPISELTSPEPPSSDEIPVLAPSSIESGESWAYRFLRLWRTRLIVTASILFGVGLPVLVYLLFQLLGPRATPDRTAAALIAGLASALALLMLSIPLILLTSLMADLVREVRRLGDLSTDRTRERNQS